MPVRHFVTATLTFDDALPKDFDRALIVEDEVALREDRDI
jgi:hypothetical protein